MEGVTTWKSVMREFGMSPRNNHQWSTGYRKVWVGNRS